MTTYTLTETQREQLMSDAKSGAYMLLESLQPNTQEPVIKEMAYEMGAKGAEPTEAERLLFEEWLRGHCWAVVGEWKGKQYLHPKEANGFVHEGAMATRRLWAAWRDRAALGAPQPADSRWKDAVLEQMANLAMDHAGTPEEVVKAVVRMAVIQATDPAINKPAEPLTDEKYDELITQVTKNVPFSWRAFARAVEQAHGIGVNP